MTRSKAFYLALAGLAGSHAQQVSVKVSLGDGTINNLEYNTEQTFTCTWKGDEDLNNANIDLNSEALQIKWYYQGNTVYTMEADDYTAYPSFGTAFFERQQINVSASVAEGFSILTLGKVQLRDVGEYKCRVSLKNPKEINGKMGYVSGNGEMEGVKVFAKPTVSFSDLNLVHDTRQVQYDKFVAENTPVNATVGPNSVVTEAVNMWTGPSEEDGSIIEELSENSESSVPVENSESVESESSESESSESESSESESIESAPAESRKRRQSETDTDIQAPEIQSTSQDIQNSLATCVVAGAYPAPSNIAVYIGDSEISNLDDTQFESSVQDDELYNTQVSVSTMINGPEQNGKAIRCVVNDAEKMYKSEAQSENLNIQYLTTEVTITTKDVVYEEDEITISCQANGNPAPILTLVHLNSEEINSSINGSSSYTIPSVVRDGDYAFQCRATSTEFPLYVMESGTIDVKVNYLEKPIIDVEGERKEVDGTFSVEVAKEFSISCEAEADPVATYTWFKDKKNIGDNNEYKVEKANWDDTGKYWCMASNGGELTKKSREITINVQGQCEVNRITVTPGKKSKDGAQSATLTCFINPEVQPACKVDWLFNKEVFKGRKKGNELELIEVSSIDESLILESVVTCQATNEFTSYKPALVLKGSEIAKQIDSQDDGIPWMYIGIAALVLVVIFVVYQKRKSGGDKPSEESQKMNQSV